MACSSNDVMNLTSLNLIFSFMRLTSFCKRRCQLGTLRLIPAMLSLFVAEAPTRLVIKDEIVFSPSKLQLGSLRNDRNHY